MLKHFALSFLIFTACTPLQKAKKMGYTVQVEYTPPPPPTGQSFFAPMPKGGIVHLSTLSDVLPYYYVRNDKEILPRYITEWDADGFEEIRKATNFIKDMDILHATYGANSLNLVGVKLQQNKIVEVVDTTENNRIWFVKNKLRRSMLTSLDIIPIEIAYHEYAYPKTPTSQYCFQQKTTIEKHYKIGDLIKIKPNVHLRLNSGFLVENNAGEIHIFLKLVCEKSDKFGRTLEKTEFGFDLDCADTIPRVQVIPQTIYPDGTIPTVRYDTIFWNEKFNIVDYGFVFTSNYYDGKRFNAFFKTNIKSNEITPADTIPE